MPFFSCVFTSFIPHKKVELFFVLDEFYVLGWKSFNGLSNLNNVAINIMFGCYIQSVDHKQFQCELACEFSLRKRNFFFFYCLIYRMLLKSNFRLKNDRLKA